MEVVFFYIFAISAISSAIMVIVSKNPVYSVIFLIFAFFSTAGLFVLLDAQFIAILQILVYAGAIIVLFLFVIMLLNLRKAQEEFSRLMMLKIYGLIVAFFFLFEILYISFKGHTTANKDIFTDIVVQNAGGNTKLLGNLLFTKYVLPFEVTSVILLAATIGAVILAKRRKLSREEILKKEKEENKE